MKKFLITTDKFTSYHYLYNLVDSEISLHKIKDTWELFQPTRINFYINLPPEIVNQIVDHLLLIYLKNGSYEYAANLIHFSKDTIRRFYYKYFGNDTLCGTMNLSFRISYTLRTCYNLFELVVGSVHNHHEFNTINLFRGDFVNKVTPWNVDDELFMVVQSERPFLTNYANFRVFRTGPSLHDQCWIQAQTIFGVAHATLFRSPIIVIVITTYDGEITLQENLDLERFEKMATLLKLAFGAHTGVFITIADSLIHELLEVVEL
jgi:hypothetical protein